MTAEKNQSLRPFVHGVDKNSAKAEPPQGWKGLACCPPSWLRDDVPTWMEDWCVISVDADFVSFMHEMTELYMFKQLKVCNADSMCVPLPKSWFDNCCDNCTLS
jgi:hypothetical protein